MRKFLTAVALLGALGLVTACYSGQRGSSQGGQVYTAPSQGSAPSGGAPSCGGAGKA